MEKALKIIASCKTLEQWEGARNYIRLFLKQHGHNDRSCEYGELILKLWAKRQTLLP